MAKFLIFTFFLATTFYKSQEKIDTISIKTNDIEMVTISDKDYEKTEISYDLKQNTNTRYMTIPNSELGLKFNNTLNKKGRISDVTLFLHKTDKDRVMTNLEINFYTLDSLTGRPDKKINRQQILFTPKNRSRGKVKINVLGYHLPFPQNGVFVAIKWLPTLNNDKKVGPCVRLTAYSEPLTYTRYMNGIWSEKGSIFSRSQYSNIMMGLDVYFKRKKNE
jgi:hypothetical protein